MNLVLNWISVITFEVLKQVFGETSLTEKVAITILYAYVIFSICLFLNISRSAIIHIWA